MKGLLHIIKQLHLWTGLTCGLIASFSGITGAIYVWQPEITVALNPQILALENFVSISEANIHSVALQLVERHGDSISALNLPYREQQTVSVVFKNGKTLFYHPVTARLLGEKSSSMIFFEGLLNLHRTLGIPGYGKYIVGGSAVLFFMLLLSSGFYIWWKRYRRKLKKGLSIKIRAKPKRFNYDLHKVTGIAFIVPLAVIAISGAYFTYVPYYKKLFSLTDIIAPKSEMVTLEPKKNTESFYKLIANPVGDYKLRAVIFPKSVEEGYHFRYIQDRSINYGLRRVKELKIKSNGELLSFTQFKTDALSDRILAQLYPIHIGEIAGLFGRILVFLTGWIPVLLLITGLRYYLFRKRGDPVK